MGRRSVWLSGGGVASLVVALSAAPAVHAQTAQGSPPDKPSAASQETTITAVIVTATRREVDVQKLPIAIDAFGVKQMRRAASSLSPTYSSCRLG